MLNKNVDYLGLIKDGLESFQNNTVSKFPMTDICWDKESGIAFVEIACAGFKKENLNIEMKQNILEISGSFSKEDDEGLEYIQRNIAKRDFVRRVALDTKYLQGTIKASYEDGLLTIAITPVEPLKQTIEIS